jgi:glucose-6-phosphate isomerase
MCTARVCLYYSCLLYICKNSTAVKKVTDFGIDAANIFPFWDWVGGRYSVCSAVGILPLSLHYGYGVMSAFLQGANDMDRHFFESPIRNNLPVLLGLLGVWNASFLKYPARAILPYAQALLRFPAHIQQLEMESNGKMVDSVSGAAIPYPTGEILFGEPGTNGQHSFYQLIHQGTTPIPCEFIGFLNSQTPINNTSELVPNHDELMSNFFAQPDALACGKTISELVAEGVPTDLQPHKEFRGNRPSSSLLLQDLNAFSTGQLLSLYEHRTAVQGFVWNINSFDQWGVELGKVLAVRVRNTLIEANKQDSASPSADASVNLNGYNPSTQRLLGLYINNKHKK